MTGFYCPTGVLWVLLYTTFESRTCLGGSFSTSESVPELNTSLLPPCHSGNAVRSKCFYPPRLESPRGQQACCIFFALFLNSSFSHVLVASLIFFFSLLLRFLVSFSEASLLLSTFPTITTGGIALIPTLFSPDFSLMEFAVDSHQRP